MDDDDTCRQYSGRCGYNLRKVFAERAGGEQIDGQKRMCSKTRPRLNCTDYVSSVICERIECIDYLINFLVNLTKISKNNKAVSPATLQN